MHPLTAARRQNACGSSPWPYIGYSIAVCALNLQRGVRHESQIHKYQSAVDFKITVTFSDHLKITTSHLPMDEWYRAKRFIPSFVLSKSLQVSTIS